VRKIDLLIIVKWLVVAYASNYRKSGLGVEEFYKKRFPIKALPNNGNILLTMCCKNDKDGPYRIILQE
jgi:hypothetical protein